MAIRNKDAELARRWCKSKQWCTVIQLMQVANGKSFLLFSFHLVLFFFFLFFFLFIEFTQPPERGSIRWYRLVKFFFTSSTTIFLTVRF